MTRTMTRAWAMVTVVGAAVVGFMGSGIRVSGAPPEKQIALTPIGVHRAFPYRFDGGGAEIAAYDAASKRVFVVNLDFDAGAGVAVNPRIDVIDISDPTAPFLTHTIPVSPWGSQANSVAVRDGLVAIAVEADDKTDPGKVVFMNAYGSLLSVVTVGALPDMVTFTPNGRFVLVANEGEPNSYGAPDSVDPEGSISIIDLTIGAANLTDHDVTTADFRAFNSATLDPSIRIFGPGASVAQDLEPEYITVAHDSKTAWVTLQENNAVAVIDLDQKKVTHLVGLGFKDHSVAGQGLDALDNSAADPEIRPWPVFGMYQPDGIASFHHMGQTYLVTANEGDVRDWPGIVPSGTQSEARRISSLTVEPAVGAVPSRLNVTTFNGNTDADAAYERLYSFGARSFSIWTAGGTRIFDSGDALEQLTRQRYPSNFNASHTNQTRDNRSDDKGPEPESVTVAKLFGRTYLFVALERIGGIAVYEVINPAAPTFVQYINVRDFTASVSSEAAGDLGPEGVLVVSDEDSPTGTPLLIVANEISGTTRIFEISQVKK